MIGMLMPVNLQEADRIRNSKIELLYQDALRAKSADDRRKILREIENVTGVKLIHKSSHASFLF